MTSPAAVSAGTPGTLGNRPGGRRPAGVVVRALIALTKPRIIELLLVTTVPTMLLAQRGVPSIRLVLVTLVGGTLAAGSANTINCYIDRDIDAVMKRTSRRPLVVNGRGTIKPWEALVWGIALGAGATLLLGLMANWLSAALADADGHVLVEPGMIAERTEEQLEAFRLDAPLVRGIFDHDMGEVGLLGERVLDGELFVILPHPRVVAVLDVVLEVGVVVDLVEGVLLLFLLRLGGLGLGGLGSGGGTSRRRQDYRYDQGQQRDQESEEILGHARAGALGFFDRGRERNLAAGIDPVRDYNQGFAAGLRPHDVARGDRNGFI